MFGSVELPQQVFHSLLCVLQFLQDLVETILQRAAFVAIFVEPSSYTFNQQFRRRHAPVGLSPSEERIYLILLRRKADTATALAARAGLPRRTVISALTALETKGAITRALDRTLRFLGCHRMSPWRRSLHDISVKATSFNRTHAGWSQR